MTMQNYFFIRTDRQFVKIMYSELICVESLGNFVRITTDNGKYLTQLSIRQLEQVLPKDSFYRINRGCIIAVDRIISFDNSHVKLKEKEIPFGETQRKFLMQRLNIITSDVRDKLKTLSIDVEGLKEQQN
jgi:DNA-binding LytR/AlgR family response regulator